jgi:hypothetical protein
MYQSSTAKVLRRLNKTGNVPPHNVAEEVDRFHPVPMLAGRFILSEYLLVRHLRMPISINREDNNPMLMPAAGQILRVSEWPLAI